MQLTVNSHSDHPHGSGLDSLPNLPTKASDCIDEPNIPLFYLLSVLRQTSHIHYHALLPHVCNINTSYFILFFYLLHVMAICTTLLIFHFFPSIARVLVNSHHHYHYLYFSLVTILLQHSFPLLDRKAQFIGHVKVVFGRDRDKVYEFNHFMHCVYTL